MTKHPYDTEKERRVITGLLKYGPDIWPDVSGFLCADDFHQASYLNFSYRPVFIAIKYFLEEKKHYDYKSVADRLKNTGSVFNGIDIEQHLDELSDKVVRQDVILEEIKELAKIRIRRRLFIGAANIAKYVLSDESKNASVAEIVSTCDSHYSKLVSMSLDSMKEAVSLTEDLYEFVNSISSDENVKILHTPFDTFNKAFGGLRLKDSYCIAGRPGHGKSAVMQWLAYATANLVESNKIDGKPIPVLCIDTEMESDEQRIRLAACIAGVDPYMIETGMWRRNSRMKEAIERELPKTQTHYYDHLYAPRFTVDELVSYVRRWIYKKVGRDNPGIVVFDYLKLSGDDLKNVSDSRLSVAYKLDRIKDLIKEETNCVLIFGAQRNRYSEKEDDSSIAESDHIQRLSNWVGLFKEKSNDDLVKQPADLFGTHALIPVKSRKLGLEGAAFKRPVKIEGKFVPNWINFRFDNFKYIEVNTGRDVENYLSI